MSLKNTVVVLAIACFASMALGLTLHLHLASVEDADHHDSAHCSLCHVILTTAAKFPLAAQTPVICNADFFETIPETGVVSPCQHTPPVLAPRPPPLCTV